MILKDLTPHPSLNEFVRCYRIVHFGFENAVDPVHKAYAPRPEICLHFFLHEHELVQLGDGPKEDHKFSVALAGQQTSVINRYLIGKNFVSFNIVFQPTAVFRLTGIPTFELTDKYLDAELIFPGNVRSVLDQFRNAASYKAMVMIADRFLTSLVSNARNDGHRLDAIARLMLTSGGKASLDWLASESCLSTKQFTRKFYERTGVNPKTLQKIIRFTNAFNIRNAYPERDWSQIAFDCGYFDYQHLAKDYKEFTNHTPNDFHLIESHSPERRLGLTAELYKSRAASVISLA